MDNFNANILLDVITWGFITSTILIFLFYCIKYGRRINNAKTFLNNFCINNIDSNNPLIISYLTLTSKRKYTSVYANDIINLDSVVKEYQIKLSVISVVPNILTSIGILGTFLGLSIAVASFDSQSSESIRTSIQTLLGGMGTAFWTSVVGMGCSAIFLFIKKHWINCLNWGIDKVCEELDAKYHKSTDEIVIAAFSYTTEDGYVASPNELLISMKESIRDMQTAIARLSTDLCDSIGNALDDSFQQKLVPIITSLSEKLENPAQTLTDSLITEFRNICNEFGNSLTRNVNEQMDDLLERFIDASNSINTLPELIEHVSNKIKDATDSTTKAYNTLIDSTSQQVEKITIISNALCESIEGVQNVLSDLSALHANLDHIPKAIMDARDAIKSASGQLEIAATDISSSIKATDQSNEVTRKAINEYIEKVSLIQSGLKDIFTEISSGLQQYSSTAKTGLQQMLDPFTSSVTAASEQIANSIAPLNDAINDLSDFSESISGLLEEFNKTLKPLDKSIENLARFKELLNK